MTLILNYQSRIIGEYDNSRRYLTTDKLAGIECCMGFLLDTDIDYYIPNTVLNENIKNVTSRPQYQVLAVLRKNKSDSLYSELCYSAKKNEFNKLLLSEAIKKKISHNLLSSDEIN